MIAHLILIFIGGEHDERAVAERDATLADARDHLLGAVFSVG